MSQNKREKKISTEADRTAKAKKDVLRYESKNTIHDYSLADLVFLSKRDLDDFSAPTFEVEDAFPENGTRNFVTSKERQSSLELKNPVR